MGERMERAPLVEALCELRFEELTPLDENSTHAFLSRIPSEFSQWSTMDEEQLRVSLEGSVPKTEVHRDRRHRFARPDGSALVQLGAAVLVVNQLPDYGGWDEFRPTILKVVAAHAATFGERRLSRIGLRYINQLHAERSAPKIGQLVTVTPSLRGVLERPIVHFYQRYELALDSPAGGVLVHQTGSRIGEPVLMLDLDVVGPVALKTSDDQALASWLSAAHDVISKSFVESLNNDYYQRLKVKS